MKLVSTRMHCDFVVGLFVFELGQFTLDFCKNFYEKLELYIYIQSFDFRPFYIRPYSSSVYLSGHRIEKSVKIQKNQSKRSNNIFNLTFSTFGNLKFELSIFGHFIFDLIVNRTCRSGFFSQLAICICPPIIQHLFKVT